MAFANHDHVGAGVSRDDFRHRSKKLVRAPLCLGRRRSGIFPGSCFLPVELVSERIPHANSRQRFLTGIAAAGGLAFINAVGTAGGFLGPSIMGWLKDLTGSFNAGLVAMAGFLLLATALTGALKLFVREE